MPHFRKITKEWQVESRKIAGEKEKEKTEETLKEIPGNTERKDLGYKGKKTSAQPLSPHL